MSQVSTGTIAVLSTSPVSSRQKTINEFIRANLSSPNAVAAALVAQRSAGNRITDEEVAAGYAAAGKPVSPAQVADYIRQYQISQTVTRTSTGIAKTPVAKIAPTVPSETERTISNASGVPVKLRDAAAWVKTKVDSGANAADIVREAEDSGFSVMDVALAAEYAGYSQKDIVKAIADKYALGFVTKMKNAGKSDAEILSFLKSSAEKFNALAKSMKSQGGPDNVQKSLAEALAFSFTTAQLPFVPKTGSPIDFESLSIGPNFVGSGVSQIIIGATHIISLQKMTATFEWPKIDGAAAYAVKIVRYAPESETFSSLVDWVVYEPRTEFDGAGWAEEAVSDRFVYKITVTGYAAIPKTQPIQDQKSLGGWAADFKFSPKMIAFWKARTKEILEEQSGNQSVGENAAVPMKLRDAAAWVKTKVESGADSMDIVDQAQAAGFNVLEVALAAEYAGYSQEEIVKAIAKKYADATERKLRAAGKNDAEILSAMEKIVNVLGQTQTKFESQGKWTGIRKALIEALTDAFVLKTLFGPPASSTGTGIDLTTSKPVFSAGSATNSSHTFTVSADPNGKILLTGLMSGISDGNGIPESGTLYVDGEAAGNEVARWSSSYGPGAPAWTFLEGPKTVLGNGGVRGVEIAAGSTRQFVLVFDSVTNAPRPGTERSFHINDAKFQPFVSTLGTYAPETGWIRGYSNVGLPTAESTYAY